MTDPHSNEARKLRELTDELRAATEKPTLDAGLEDALMARIAQEPKPKRSGMPRGGSIVVPFAIAAAAVFALAHHYRTPEAASAPIAIETPAPTPVRAVFESGDKEVRIDRPGMLALVLEPHSRAEVIEDDSKMELSLVSGALRAHVVPSPVPEKLVVDVDSVRVAVHGTELRVARQERAEVDVIEGVVLVTARGDGFAPTRLPAETGGSFDRGAHDATLRPVVSFASTPFVVSAEEVDTKSDRRAQVPAAIVPRLDEATLRARASTIASACFQHEGPTTGLQITATSTLDLEVGADGRVKGTTFDPPLAPAVLACFKRDAASLRGNAGHVIVPLTLNAVR